MAPGVGSQVRSMLVWPLVVAVRPVGVAGGLTRVVAVAGVILLAAPFALGVPILFALAIWILARGASGVWALKSGREIADPHGWWI